MHYMKGILLAGGLGSRLYPTTKEVSKHLLNVYDKPMIYYPLSTLLLAGIKDLLIISNDSTLPLYKNLFGDGSKFGIHISYSLQKEPKGIAEAFLIAEKFIHDDDVCLILGDNLFYGEGFEPMLTRVVNNTVNNKKATIFGYYIENPNAYGVIELLDNKVISIEEKPKNPKSNIAVVGIYFFPNSVVKLSKKITPSERGELEIISVIELYLKSNKLNVEILDKSYKWMDMGDSDSLLEASNFIQFQQRQNNIKIACLEEITFKKGYITEKKLISLSNELDASDYGKYLLTLLE